MSYMFDETYDVYIEKKRKASKSHVCSACKEAIHPKEYYFNISCVFQGEAATIKRCARCQTMHLNLRKMDKDCEDLWPDEKLNCGEEFEEHWGEPPSREMVELAFITPKEAQKLVEQ